MQWESVDRHDDGPPPSEAHSSNRTGRISNQIVISKATMMSPIRVSAANEMETMVKNSFSDRIRDIVMIADPTPNETPNVINSLTQDGRAGTDRSLQRLTSSHVKKVL